MQVQQVARQIDNESKWSLAFEVTCASRRLLRWLSSAGARRKTRTNCTDSAERCRREVELTATTTQKTRAAGTRTATPSAV